jgi:hypothetical protein
VSSEAETPGDVDGAAWAQVAYADDPLEAEMIRGLLESGNIPALIGPRGMDGPMWGHASLRPGFDGGGRRVMVAADRAEEARTLIAKTLAENEEP